MKIRVKKSELQTMIQEELTGKKTGLIRESKENTLLRRMIRETLYVQMKEQFINEGMFGNIWAGIKGAATGQVAQKVTGALATVGQNLAKDIQATVGEFKQAVQTSKDNAAKSDLLKLSQTSSQNISNSMKALIAKLKPQVDAFDQKFPQLSAEKGMARDAIVSAIRVAANQAIIDFLKNAPIKDVSKQTQGTLGSANKAVNKQAQGQAQGQAQPQV